METFTTLMGSTLVASQCHGMFRTFVSQVLNVITPALKPFLHFVETTCLNEKESPFYPTYGKMFQSLGPERNGKTFYMPSFPFP